MRWIEKSLSPFENGLDVLYHRAKFGEDQTTRAGCRCENMVFVCLCFVCLSFVHAACLPARCSFEGTYSEQVLCHGLWVHFDADLAFFSEGIALSYGLDIAHFCRQVAPQDSQICCKVSRRIFAKYFVYMVTIEIVINSNHVAQNFALHPADMHCPAWAMQSFLVFFLCARTRYILPWFSSGMPMS